MKIVFLGVHIFFFTGNSNRWLLKTHLPTQVRTLFRFVNLYGKLDTPAEKFLLSLFSQYVLLYYWNRSIPLYLVVLTCVLARRSLASIAPSHCLTAWCILSFCFTEFLNLCICILQISNTTRLESAKL